MTGPGLIPIVAFLMVASGVVMAYLVLAGRTNREDERLDELAGDGRPGNGPAPESMARFARSALPKVGGSLMPTDEGERTLLATRLVHAGLYGKQSMHVYLGVKLLLMVGPFLAGLGAGLSGLVDLSYGALAGACLGIFGMLGPSFWLDSKKAARQLAFRRSLPDALDVLVICLEGGLSLPGALQKVGGELRSAHEALSFELGIVQREIRLGRSPGQALQQMGQRTDLEEVRSLAGIINQSERFGASLVKSLRTHAETLRERRKQKAEELAQKAGTKILFPTLLFIFPAIFVVILGPATFQVMEFLSVMGSPR